MQVLHACVINYAGSQGGILVSVQKFLDNFHCPFYLVLGRKFSYDNHAVYVGASTYLIIMVLAICI